MKIMDLETCCILMHATGDFLDVNVMNKFIDFTIDLN